MAKHAPQQVQSGNRAYPHSIRPTAIALAVAACFSGPVLANPTNPTVVHGAATFATAGNILNITNSHNAIINWGSFSIGVNELTKFIQPSALSAVLNRVTGQDPSAILGALQSNGKVFLLNPNGIVFGSGAQINVAGLVASTLNLSNDDFLNNRMRFTDGAGAGSVVNNGSITGGSVYLVGNAVTNNGLITSPGGEVVLAAGNSVELVNPGTPDLRVEVVAPDNEARNLGTITAEAGRIGIYAGLIKQSGTIRADSAVSEGGRIILKSTKKTSLDEGSLTSARGTRGGEIIALSSMTDGVTEVAGKMDASGTAGNGGFIETSAAKVKIADTAVITAASTGGNAGTWLIDPNDFYISSSYGGDIDGTTLANQLNAYGGTNVSIISDNGMAYGSGNIYVNDTVSWNSTGALTLIARNNVEVNNAIANGGTGGVNLYAGWDGVSPLTPAVGSVGEILLNAPISTLGGIKLVAGSNIVQGAPGSLSAANLLATSNAGFVNLANSMATNTVGTIAGSAIGSFAFKNSGNLTISSVGGVNGITVNGVNPGNNASIDVNVTGGQLLINRRVSAQGANAGGIVPATGGNATIVLSATNGITVDSSDFRAVEALGGSGAYGGTGGAASIQLTAASGAISIDGGEVYALGGQGGYNAGIYGIGGEAKIRVQAGGGVTVSAEGGEGCCTSIEAYGGNGGTGGAATVELTSASASVQILSASVEANGGDGSEGGGSGGGNATTTIQANGGNVLIENSSVYARGGSGDYYGSTGNGGTGVVNVGSAGSIAITDSYIDASGGSGAAYGGSTVNGGNAVVLISAAGSLTVSNSLLEVSGGSANSGQGGAAGLTMLAGGNIQFEGAEGSVYGGGSNAVGGDAGILVQSLGGNIVLDSTYYSETLSAAGGGNTPGMKSVVVSAAGNVSLLNEATVYSSGTAGIFSGGNVSLDNSYVYAESSASVTATGSLSLANDSVIIGGGNAYIKTGGNVTVDDSGIVGSPDVFMTVGGVVNINNGGAVVAGAPTTIHLTFPMLLSGGYFINGIEGVVFDPLTGTGFMADGSPAILGTNLLVTYGGIINSNLNVPTDALIVAMGESTKPPDPEKDKDLFEDIKDKDKDAPVCR